jgi:hypothetical protein
VDNNNIEIKQYCNSYIYIWTYDIWYDFMTYVTYDVAFNEDEHVYINIALLMFPLLSHTWYPPVNVYISIENHHFLWVIQRFLWPWLQWLFVYFTIGRVGFPGNIFTGNHGETPKYQGFKRMLYIHHVFSWI